MPDIAIAQAPRWNLRSQKRFLVGEAKRRAAVFEVYSDWLEFEFENDDGTVEQPRKIYGVLTTTFLASIVSEIESVPTKEAEDRGYR